VRGEAGRYHWPPPVKICQNAGDNGSKNRPRYCYTDNKRLFHRVERKFFGKEEESACERLQEIGGALPYCYGIRTNAPDITPVSYPNRNPHRAEMKVTNRRYRWDLLFDAAIASLLIDSTRFAERTRAVGSYANRKVEIKGIKLGERRKAAAQLSN
jgi:hypothetical protein